MTGGVERSTIFITASTAWALRNYVQTGVARRLAETHAVVVLTVPRLEEWLRRNGHDSYVEIAVAPELPEPPRWRLGRRAKKSAYMEAYRVETESIWSRFGNRPLYQRIAAPFVRIATALVGGWRVFRLVSALDRWVNRSRIFRDLFERRRPALLFATHASNYFEDAVLRSAASAGIPAAFMVLSWDHLSTKVILDPAHERVLVWTDYQRDEVLRTYPWYGPEDVEVVGIPHYDPYFRRCPSTREEWATRHGLDPRKRTVIFYTIPQVRHRDQHLIVRDIARAIEEGTLPTDIQLLVKCHPLDDWDVYREVVAEFDHVAMYPPGAWEKPDPTQWVPATDEIEISHDMLVHADVTINVYSTVTIEAAAFDKPIIHIGFDVRPVPPGRVPCREYYNFTHFRPVVETGAAAMALSRQELHRLISEALAKPEERQEERKKLVSLFMGPKDGRSSERVAESLARILRDAWDGAS